MFSVSLQHMGTQRECDRLPTRKGAPTRARPSGGLIDLKTRGAIRNLLHHFHKKPNEIQAPAASGSQTTPSGCFCISALQ